MPVLAPVVVFYGNSDVTDGSGVNETVAGVSWVAGDRVLVFGAVSSDGAANQLATPTITGLSGTGLTFALDASVNNSATNTDTQVFQWTALATGTGSGTVQSVNTAGGSLRAVITVTVYRGCSGFGTPVALDASAAKVISIPRVRPNSAVAVMMADFNAVNDTVVDATPTGTVRFAAFETGQATFFYVTFDDQGVPATTNYGITNHTGTVDMSGLGVEAFGTATPEVNGFSIAMLADWKPSRWDYPLNSDLLLDDFIRAAGGGTSINVGLTTSTNTAFAVGKRKSKAVGLTTQSNSSLAVTRRKSKAVGLSTQSSSALSVGRRKSKLLGLASSANTALAVIAPHFVSVGLAVSASTALAVGRLKRKTLGLAASAASAFAVGRRKAKTLGLTVSANTALVARPLRLKVVGLVASAAVAFAVGRRKSKVLGLPTESDSARAVTSTGGGGSGATGSGGWLAAFIRRRFLD
jgi:hypothetical protein